MPCLEQQMSHKPVIRSFRPRHFRFAHELFKPYIERNMGKGPYFISKQCMPRLDCASVQAYLVLQYSTIDSTIIGDSTTRHRGFDQTERMRTLNL